MPTFGYSQNWGTGVPRTSTSGAKESPTLVHSATPSGGNDLSWLSALPALSGLASAIPTLLGDGEKGSKSTAAQQALVSALQAGASSAGQGTLGSFIPALASLAAGNTEGALRSGSGAATAAGASALGAPGWAIGPLATLASGLVSGDTTGHLIEDTGNSAIGSLAGLAAGPVGTVVYQLARKLGVNPMQLIGENTALRQEMYPDLVPGFEGGLIGKQGVGDGIRLGVEEPGLHVLDGGGEGLRAPNPDSRTGWLGVVGSHDASSYQREGAPVETPRLAIRMNDDYRPSSTPAPRDDYSPTSAPPPRDDYRPTSSGSTYTGTNSGSGLNGTSDSGMHGGDGAYADGGRVKNAWGF